MTKSSSRWFVMIAMAAISVATLAMLINPIARAGEDDAESEKRAWLGVMLDGLKVRDVAEGGGAQAAGIEEGDVILAIDGDEVQHSGDIIREIRKRSPGDRIRVTVQRKSGGEQDLDATLGAAERNYSFNWSFEGDGEDWGEWSEKLREGLGHLPEQMGKLHEHFEWHGGEGEHGRHGMWALRGSRGFLGVSLLTPSDDLREVFGGQPGVGVLVNQVVEDSPADKAGLQAGDLIVAVDGEEVGGAGDLMRAMRNRKPEETVQIDVLRNGRTRSFDATLEKSQHGGLFMVEPGSLSGLDLDEGELEARIEDAMEKARRALEEIEKSGLGDREMKLEIEERLRERLDRRHAERFARIEALDARRAVLEADRLAEVERHDAMRAERDLQRKRAREMRDRANELRDRRRQFQERTQPMGLYDI